MHELGVVFQIIKTVEQVAKENNLKTIQSVTVELGEVSGVIKVISTIAGYGQQIDRK